MAETPTLPDDREDLAALIPGEVLASLRRYAAHHVPTGGFLAAVLANDLAEAVGRADAINATYLPAIVRYVWNCLPRNCHGSREAVEAWTTVRVAGDV